MSHTMEEQALSVIDFGNDSLELIFGTCPPSRENLASLFSLTTKSL